MSFLNQLLDFIIKKFLVVKFMAFRTIVVKNRCKLEYSLGYMIYRSQEDVKKILLDEIEMLILQNTSISITTALINELNSKKIKVIFCDEKQNPASELVGYYNNFETYKKIKEQIAYSVDFMDILWKEIIYHKINNSLRVIRKHKPDSVDNIQKVEEYLMTIENGDITNREGHCAKVYFNTCFGSDFVRGDEKDERNMFLNYGYALIVSLINREIKSFGYLTELGIHHRGITNQFNLSYDFVEPLRLLIDNYVLSKSVDIKNYKSFFNNIFERKVIIGEKFMFLDNAIHIYVQSMFTALNKCDIKQAKFIEYEL